MNRTYNGERGNHPGIEQKKDTTASPQADHAALATALEEALHVTRNGSFDPERGCDYRPGGTDLRQRLEERWNELVLATTGKAKTEATDGWFRTLYEKHTEAGRYYHTAVHLWEMFELLDIVANACVNPSAPGWYVPMAWAVLFHDSIYDPRSKRNEKDSAELFRAFVHADKAVAMDSTTCNAVLTMILATEKHQVLANGREEDEFVAMQKHFLDIDMAVLGKHGTAYMKYAALVRKEYNFVPRDVYCSARADILENFLSETSNESGTTTGAKHVYLTNAFREAFETRAEDNLREEINLLRNNTIPE